ncbi:DUF3043 domain-containing protein [Corynebacterium auriscanis]|uniref:DUF3043 domain-containing protein n=1 Tax=Corynebacterium auriscanis TaxID=99807 RepID=UPI002245274F|nr:DUF3043 domain-containing protein [Corynebacterium auriscanis]MCX2163117.1 DUF3043 domain-containing protein [Corynebacterium auriscanis]
MKTPWKKTQNTSSETQPGTARRVSESDVASDKKETTAEPKAPVVTNEHDQGQKASTDDVHSTKGSAFTPKKGRPTPKRNEVEREQGIRREAFEAPTTPAEARKRRKELKASMSKEEYKAMKQRERDQAARERRRVNERMMAGDEKYLMARDQGPERKFVRDWVDSHRYLMNLFLPMTLIVILLMIIGVRNPQVANLASIVMMVIFLIMIGEGVWLGRKINRMVRERFSHTTQGGFGLGLYAFTRATMIRRLRTPAPQKQPGDKV